jgi:hypothetical protein
VKCLAAEARERSTQQAACWDALCRAVVCAGSVRRVGQVRGGGGAEGGVGVVPRPTGRWWRVGLCAAPTCPCVPGRACRVGSCGKVCEPSTVEALTGERQRHGAAVSPCDCV